MTRYRLIALAAGILTGFIVLSYFQRTRDRHEMVGFTSSIDNPNPTVMTLIRGGTFSMGSTDSDARPDEGPIHHVRLDSFWIDQTPVTNAQFHEFIKATRYITTAERKPDWNELKKQLPEATPKPSEEKLVAASMVFHPTAEPVTLDDPSKWWTWTPGANWQHPEGPDSNISARADFPVVQVSWEDANAYAKWAGKRLPTEAEYEYAARGGLRSKRFAWGDEDPSNECTHCNIWRGHFPDNNTAKAGPGATNVYSFPPNPFGLYDMAGNVWEWCSDWYRPDTYTTDQSKGIVQNPTGPSSSHDPDEPYAQKRVTRGGSFLCNAAYCSSYRVAARMKSTPDTSSNHIGFRCAKSAKR